MGWEILLLSWIVGIPVGALVLSELLYRRKQRLRRASARAYRSAQVIRLVPRPGTAAAAAARGAAAGTRRP